jgi:hypothetical protein
MPPRNPPEILANDRVIGATASGLAHLPCQTRSPNSVQQHRLTSFAVQGFCLNRVGLVVRVEGQGLARRFFVHWDDHPAKVILVSNAAVLRSNFYTRNHRMRWHGAACCTMKKVRDQV